MYSVHSNQVIVQLYVKYVGLCVRVDANINNYFSV